MGQDSILKTKSLRFAVRIVNLCKYLKQTHREYVMSQQILRSGTAIGALIREAEFGESRKDFMHKLNIALKEANETIYWLQLLLATGYITEGMYDSMHADALELLKMLAASVKTMKETEV